MPALRRPVCLLAWFAAGLVACTAPQVPVGVQQNAPLVPEGPSGYTAKLGVAFQRFAVASANPLASEAGYQVLHAGGTAIDAAVAVQMVLTLVEPQSSGIGGGAFILHWDGQHIDGFDGRETAPAAATEGLFLTADGKPMAYSQAVVGGRPVGVPGAVAALEAAHRLHGRLPWADLFRQAIALAEGGFAVSARLSAALQDETAMRRVAPASTFYYDAAGQPWPVGHVLRNPALGAVFRRLALEGSAAFYKGSIAIDIAGRVQGYSSNPGSLTAADLAGYQVVRRSSMCTDWLDHFRVCGFPPPSSGHLAVMQILGMLEQLPTQAPALVDGLPAADWLHQYTEASRLAFADRAQYVGDPAFVAAPGPDWHSLLAPAYLKQRAALIGDRSMRQALPGQPAGVRSAWAAQTEQPEYGTSHLSVIDAQGHAIAMTTTIEAVWGSRLMSDGGTGLAGGFMLNNELTDFSFLPTDASGRPVANRVQAGKRPRSSMSPTLVFDRRDGRLLMTMGSPGGPVIIHFVAKTLLGTMAWGLNAQRAIDLPNFGSLNGPTFLERGRFPEATLEALKARGHDVREADLTSGLQALQRTPTGWLGGADPRREGAVRGD